MFIDRIVRILDLHRTLPIFILIRLFILLLLMVKVFLQSLGRRLFPILHLLRLIFMLNVGRPWLSIWIGHFRVRILLGMRWGCRWFLRFYKVWAILARKTLLARIFVWVIVVFSFVSILYLLKRLWNLNEDTKVVQILLNTVSVVFQFYQIIFNHF